MKKVFFAIVALLFIGGASVADEERLCDIDGDGDVDRVDVRQIFDQRGTYADGPDDPYDVNGDGVISINDGRMCVLLCDLQRCVSPQ